MNGRRFKASSSGSGQSDRSATPDAYQKALELLVRREHSRRELGRKLTARGIDRDAADAAMDKLAAQGFQDETRFAEMLVRSRAAGGHGPLRIRAELAMHGLSREAIQAAMDGCDTDWTESARAQLGRRYSATDLADPVKRRKAVEFLLRRGFEQAVAYAATRDRDADRVD
jgi:regulatory protein